MSYADSGEKVSYEGLKRPLSQEGAFFLEMARLGYDADFVARMVLRRCAGTGKLDWLIEAAKRLK